jgi:hypothetical protein
VSPVNDLLDALRRAGVALSRSGGDLRYTAPAGTMTPELKAAVVSHKAELLWLVGPCPWCGCPLDRGRCWRCHDRRCEVCRTRNTGSAFIAVCLVCQFTPGLPHLLSQD